MKCKCIGHRIRSYSLWEVALEVRSQENKCPTLILDPDVHLPDFLLDVSIGRTNENLEGLCGDLR